MARRVIEEELRKKSVFIDAGKLLPEYVPPTLVHREKELRWLAQVFRPLLQSGASQKAVITGNIGVGKTVLSLKFGNELEGLAKERGLTIDFMYINCRTEKRAHPICARLAQHYNPRWPYTSLGPEKLLDMVFAYLATHGRYLLLVLDEADYFVQLNGPDLIYLLTRAGEKSGGKSRVSLIAVSRDQSFLYRLDAPTRSTFLHNVLNLPNYTPKQLEDIMNKRIPEAFKPGAVDPETVELIAEIAGRSGNARFALELLWKAGLIADRDGEEIVLPEHAREAKAD
ncbi:MAG: Cdc6/Cdc18 family protein, partial [Candidatus Hadarchaeales archaeon]